MDKKASTNNFINKDSYENKTVVQYYDSLANMGLLAYEKIILNRYIKADYTVLDIGCGTGRTTKAIYDKKAKVTGIDFSKGMIDKAKKNFPEIDFQVCDAKNLKPFKDNYFDIVFFSFNGFGLLPQNDKESSMREITRVLKKGGVFIFTMPSIDTESEYISEKVKAENLNLDNYYDRLKIGEFFFDDNGAIVNVYMLFEKDLINLLAPNDLKILLKKSSYEIEGDINHMMNNTTIWVVQKTS